LSERGHQKSDNYRRRKKGNPPETNQTNSRLKDLAPILAPPWRKSSPALHTVRRGGTVPRDRRTAWRAVDDARGAASARSNGGHHGADCCSWSASIARTVRRGAVV